MKARAFSTTMALLVSAALAGSTVAWAQDVSKGGKNGAVDAEAGIKSFPVQPSAYPAASSRASWALGGVELPSGDVVTLDMTRFDVFAPSAGLLASGEGGDVALARPPVALFRGVVRGMDGSRAFLSVSPLGVYGLATVGGREFVISSGAPGQGLPSVIYEIAALPVGLIRWKEFLCATTSDLRPPGAGQPGGGQGGIAAGPCRSADIAIETDYEFTQDLFGGSTSAATAYIGTLLGAVSEIYERDLNVELVVVFSRLWTSPSDPWTQGDSTNQLFEFQDYWNLNMTGQSRHAAHFLSGRALGGGVAYLPGLCQFEYDYGLSGNLDGFFPYPIQNNHSQNWDLMVTAHELGHNFGANHTHEVTPPIDCCGGAYGGSGCGGTQDCSVVPNATIMSYCHLCSGGLANVRMEFHARTINEDILPYLANDAPCDLVIGGATISDQPDSVTVCDGASATFSVAATAPDPPISYQWRKDGVNLTDGGNISGAATATLSVSPVGGGDAGSYDCVLSTSLCAAVTSSAATLTVGGGTVSLPFSETWPSTTFDSGKWPTIIGSATIDTGGPSEPSAPNSLHLEATEGVESACMNLVGSGGATFSYHWARSGTETGDDLEVYYLDNAGAWVLLTTHLAGGNSGSYTLASYNLPGAALHGAFRIRFLASCSSTSDEWYVDDINVASSCTSPSFSAHPGSQTVNVGDPVTFGVTASGTAPLAYQWRKDGVNIGGATTSSYNIASVALSDAGVYDCVVTNACGSADSNDATLTVNAPCEPCDVNCDGSVNPFDINDFLAALSGGPGCSPCAGDANADGTVNPFDINTFLVCMGG